MVDCVGVGVGGDGDDADAAVCGIEFGLVAVVVSAAVAGLVGLDVRHVCIGCNRIGGVGKTSYTVSRPSPG